MYPSQLTPMVVLFYSNFVDLFALLLEKKKRIIQIWVKKKILATPIPLLMKCERIQNKLKKSGAMMLWGRWPTQSNQEVCFWGSNLGFKYLRIFLKQDLTQLFDGNYNTIIMEVRNDLIKWGILLLSMLGINGDHNNEYIASIPLLISVSIH